MAKLVVANWKMEKTYRESVAWVEAYKPLLVSCDGRVELALCPSYTSLSTIGALLHDTGIKLGAQNCSEHERGPFTGDVSALSLKELGCTYCIVGHSERRLYHGETDMMIAQKAVILVRSGIIPIVCIGESGQGQTDPGTAA